MTSTVGDDIQRNMQLQKLEFEIKLQRLTNELQELKRESSVGKNSDFEIHQLPLERAVSQARGQGQDTSDLLAFPVLEIREQENRIRQYQTLGFKVIIELKAAVVSTALWLLLHKLY